MKLEDLERQLQEEKISTEIANSMISELQTKLKDSNDYSMFQDVLKEMTLEGEDNSAKDNYSQDDFLNELEKEKNK